MIHYSTIDIIDGNTNIVDGIKLLTSIGENSRILCPPSIEEYLHIPYEFSSIEEIKSFIEKAKKKQYFHYF